MKNFIDKISSRSFTQIITESNAASSERIVQIGPLYDIAAIQTDQASQGKDLFIPFYVIQNTTLNGIIASVQPK